ncbi:TrmH family RNA methyltransferase [Thiobacter aerophilum]|uniref:RNA methyltransferase n=1 Tax=Thiobacter aerophilum TaxID=3121275 RepID=A0ABV0EAJ9_9BURK
MSAVSAPVRISSADNPLVRSVRKLLTSARERRRQRRTVLDGWHLLEAFRAAGGVPERVLLAARLKDTVATHALLAGLDARRIALLDDALLDALAPVDTPSGVLTLIAIPTAPRREVRLALLLEDIQDPGNLGSMLRSAAAAAADAVYLSKGCADAWSPRALRGGMGAQFALALYEDADLVAVARAFPGEVIATSLAARASLYDLDLRGRVAFAFGNEGAGLSAELLAAARCCVRIPMPGGIESLNAAAAAAVCLFERVRQLQARP